MQKADLVWPTVHEVIAKFPPETRLLNKVDGKIYIMGVKQGVANFWIMRIESPKKGIASAVQILRDFERADVSL